MTRDERQYLQWTPAADERLREMWQAGVSARAIGAELERTSNAILSRSAKLALPSREKKQFPHVSPNASWPPGMAFEDDPRIDDEHDRATPRVRGDVTAKMMGDPEPRPTLKPSYPPRK